MTTPTFLCLSVARIHQWVVSASDLRVLVTEMLGRSDDSHLCSAADYRSSVTCVGQVWQELPHRNGKARLIEYQRRSLHARCILSHVIIPSLPSSASHTNPTVTLQSRLSLPLPSICQLGNRGDGKGTKAPFITLTAFAWDSVLPGKG